jgi:hypothetical protein
MVVGKAPRASLGVGSHLWELLDGLTFTLILCSQIEQKQKSKHPSQHKGASSTMFNADIKHPRTMKQHVVEHAAWIEWNVTRKRRHNHDLEDPHIDPVVQEHMSVSAEHYSLAVQLQQQHQQLLLQQHLNFHYGVESHQHMQQQQTVAAAAASIVQPQPPLDDGTQQRQRQAKMRRLDGNFWGNLHILTNHLHQASKYTH